MSRLKAPWTAAILLLVLIWTVFFIQNYGGVRQQSDTSVTETAIEKTKQFINGAKNVIDPVVAVAPAEPVKTSTRQADPVDDEPVVETAPVKTHDPIDEPAPVRTHDPIDELPEIAPEVNEKTAEESADEKRAASIERRADDAPRPAATSKVVATDSNLDSAAKTERPLILYAYSQSDTAEANLRFFIKHALHDRADFVFIINGESPQALELIPDKSNIKIVERPNDCYDLGAYAEVLQSDGNLYKKYKKFILLNASIRGPFMPAWTEACWMDAYLNKVTDSTKLVGMTGNCLPQFHVQSMIWATDSVGIDLLLHPPQPKILPEGFPANYTEVGINGCFHDWSSAVHAEIYSTQIIRDAGYKVDVMMAAFQSDEDYIVHCDTGGSGDVLWNGFYFGTNVHPFETIFMKTNRDIDPVLMRKLSEWVEGSEYSSYEKCGA